LIPGVTRGARNAQCGHGVDLDIAGSVGGSVRRRIAALTLTQNAVDAADQALEGGVIDVIGAVKVSMMWASLRFAAAFQTASARASSVTVGPSRL